MTGIDLPFTAARWVNSWTCPSSSRMRRWASGESWASEPPHIEQRFSGADSAFVIADGDPTRVVVVRVVVVVDMTTWGKFTPRSEFTECEQGTEYTLPTVEGCCRIWLYPVVVVKPDIKGLCEIKNETRSDLSPLEGVHLLHTAPPVYWCPMSASFFFIQFTCASIAVSSISTHSLPYSVSLPPSATCHFIPRPQCPVGSKCDISWWDQRPHGRRILLRPLLRHLIYQCPRRYKGIPLTSPLPRFNGAQYQRFLHGPHEERCVALWAPLSVARILHTGCRLSRFG